jgi:hypothetical protein
MGHPNLAARAANFSLNSGGSHDFEADVKAIDGQQVP